MSSPNGIHCFRVRACASVCPIRQVMDCNSDGLQCLLGCTACWWVYAIDYWQGANVKCRRHGMACSVMEAQSHDEGRVEEV